MFDIYFSINLNQIYFVYKNLFYRDIWNPGFVFLKLRSLLSVIKSQKTIQPWEIKDDSYNLRDSVKENFIGNLKQKRKKEHFESDIPNVNNISVNNIKPKIKAGIVLMK